MESFYCARLRVALCLVAFPLVALACGQLFAQWDPPASYYNNATGTGSTLKTNLRNVMSAGHIQRKYGDSRFSAAITDADPDHPGNILLVYNRASVSNVWDGSPSSDWNREHVWPKSRQPQTNINNNTKGNAGDPHALRPANLQINSNRGNDPFGFDTTTGSHRTVGSYYFPGDIDKGDIARQLFYSDVRYSSTGLSLTDGFPSGNQQMGDLSSLVAWHYLDTPDEFERRRNHTIFSSTHNPSFFTNNRNAFIDHPEFVWSVYMDQSNDSRISIGGTSVASNGSSSLTVDLGSAYIGGAVPAAQSVTLNKAGNDGTYFQVTPSATATSSLKGSFNAFRTNGTDSTTFDVGINANTSTAGTFAGTITVDNLDITTGGGTGHGASDANDVITVQFDVLGHPQASLSGNIEVLSQAFDFGTVAVGSGTVSEGFSINNLFEISGPSLVADLDLDSISSSGDTSALSLDLNTFTGLGWGQATAFDALFTPDTIGQFSASYTFNLSDEDLPGEQFQTLTLSVMGEVIAAGLAGDYNDDGVVDSGDYTTWLDALGGTTLLNEGVSLGIVDAADYDFWKANFGATSASGSTQPVPEPTSLLLSIACGFAILAYRSPTRGH